MKKHTTVTVLENRRIAQAAWRMRMTCPKETLRLFRPGQFMHIAVPGARELLLRRPISINHADAEAGEVQIVYQVAGRGTAVLEQAGAGDTLDVLMPLGNGFLVKPEMKKIWLVGGGVGVAPLLSLPDKYPGREYTAFLGFRSKEHVYQEAEFRAFADVSISTDDGSYGECGFCTGALQKRLEEERPDVILACGPGPFFRALAGACGGVPAQVSLEQHMGCGTGGCAVCVCKVKGEYRRVCVEGPVFPLADVEV